MPKWKIRDPQAYPSNYFAAVLEAHRTERPILLFQSRTNPIARTARDTFRAWRRCLREWPGADRSPCGVIETQHRITTLVEDRDGQFLTYVEIKPRIENSWDKLNPELAGLMD